MRTSFGWTGSTTLSLLALCGVVMGQTSSPDPISIPSVPLASEGGRQTATDATNGGASTERTPDANGDTKFQTEILFAATDSVIDKAMRQSDIDPGGAIRSLEAFLDSVMTQDTLRLNDRREVECRVMTALNRILSLSAGTEVHGAQSAETKPIVARADAISMGIPHLDGPPAQSSVVDVSMLPTSSGESLFLLPAVNVHNRQTVPLSKRMAEIWVTFPEGIDAWVSVNYVEYPPEGSVRVFRSSLRHDGSRAYRISARYRTDKGWVYLRATGATVKRELDAHSFEVKVQPGDQVRVAFQFQ